MSGAPDLQAMLSDMIVARDAMRAVLSPTPVIPSRRHGAEDRNIVLKLEVMQPTGSFKVRGMLNAVTRLDPDRRAAGLKTISAGNTALALAWAAKRFGTTARSVMPDTAPSIKVDAFKALGGEPILMPRDELFSYMQAEGWSSDPFAFVHPWVDPDLLIGHGSLGLELVEQVPEMARVFIPVGGGGLCSGVACSIKAQRPDVTIIAVEPEGCCAFHASMGVGAASAAPCDTFCDGVAVPYLMDQVFGLLRHVVDETVVVSEIDVRRAVKQLAVESKLVVEGAGALALAAAQQYPVDGAPSVAIVTGGNITSSVHAEILAADD